MLHLRLSYARDGPTHASCTEPATASRAICAASSGVQPAFVASRSRARNSCSRARWAAVVRRLVLRFHDFKDRYLSSKFLHPPLDVSVLDEPLAGFLSEDDEHRRFFVVAVIANDLIRNELAE